MAMFRYITITGTFDQCKLAYSIIADQVNEFARTHPADGEYVLTLLVPNNKVGGLIGQKGAVIREFRAKAGAHIHLAPPGDMHEGSLDRVVTIAGSFAQVRCSVKSLYLSMIADSGRVLF